MAAIVLLWILLVGFGSEFVPFIDASKYLEIKPIEYTTHAAENQFNSSLVHFYLHTK